MNNVIILKIIIYNVTVMGNTSLRYDLKRENKYSQLHSCTQGIYKNCKEDIKSKQHKPRKETEVC